MKSCVATGYWLLATDYCLQATSQGTTRRSSPTISRLEYKTDCKDLKLCGEHIKQE